jgi:sn-glycerol 3-phosphate transport system substrate-binding protein
MIDGKTYGIPFQRSTPVLYYNKEAFAEAGLTEAPATWEEMKDYASKLTKKDDSGNVTQWGVRIPSSGFPYWLFQGLTTSNGATLVTDNGTKTHFDDPKVVEALEYLVSLSNDGVMAPGIIEWGATPKAFFEGQTAMMWTSTGNLTNVRKNAPFDFGVAMLPAKMSRGAPTGGGNFYLFKGGSDEETKAAFDFIKWISQPAQAAKWSIATGYVAPSPATWESDEMKAYTADFPPALVARDQLEFAVAELSTYENQRVTRIFNDALHAAITGAKPAAEALAEAQAKAEAVLKAYR